MSVMERAHGVDAVELALRSATGSGAVAAAPADRPARAAVAAQLRSTLSPGTAGRITGRLPETGRAPADGRDDGVQVVAVSGYDPNDRLDGWYDALLATVSAAAPDTAAAARAASDVLSGMPDAGVPHDGADVRAVLGRLAAGSAVPRA
jgi:biotin carboxylase